MTWRPRYLALAALVFTIEVLIALFVRDRFVRPYLGDTLAVVMVYCGAMAVLPLRPMGAAALAFGVAALIELGQALNLLDLIGLRDNVMARVVLGGSFEWLDFIAYAAGAALVLMVDRRVLSE